MRKAIWFCLGAISLALSLCVTAFVLLKTSTHGFSARAKPTTFERAIAERARLIAFPATAKTQTNLIKNSQEVLADARAHWADHCAVCHGNDGRGDTEMGKNMYPPAPDMRQGDTQSLTDGELFYIIENGIRLSGMPGWGDGSQHSQEDSWKLVHFIRHLPALSEKEVQEMEELNPKTTQERQEEQEEEQFLKAQPPSGQTTNIKSHHH